ncbi:RE1-silencing transcription factor A [Oryzias melastigma]|uniref:RE1-silencing transcription factor A n=1 Tax=Oryzias melastigma TaxID=30732 RepID=A0A834C7U1_ORYME|nr:RE1-silencing transcription factor A [Oryzias melastigma]
MECHLKTHCKMEYRCRICQGLWPDQTSLEAHMRGHRLGNHYKCEQCGYLSKTANKLIEHVRVHTGERPFHCDRCSYSCKRKDNLNLHKKLKHAPRQVFGCQECPFTTTHPFVFSRHLKKHQGGAPEGLDGGLAGGEEEGEEEGAGREERPAEGASPGRSSLQRSQENILFGGGGSSGGSGSSSPLMSLTASQALQSVALSLTLGKSRQLDATGHLHRNGGSGAPRNHGGVSRSSPSLFPPSARHTLEQYRNCDPAHLIPLTTLFTHNHRFTFHPQLNSKCRPLLSPPDSAPPSLSSPSPSSSHKHSFLAYLGLMERAKTV